MPILVLSSLMLTAPGAMQKHQQSARPLARQVDHLVVQSDDPKQLYSVLTGTLRLPVASPLREAADSVTAGIGVGNLSIELFRSAGRMKSQRPQSHITGMAFEPYRLELALTELKARGIPFSEPQSYTATLPDGTQGALSTSVVLPELSNPAISVFLFEYARAFLNVQIRRRQWAGEMVLNKGGPLGIQRVAEIVIGTSDLKRDKLRWGRFLLPAEPSPSDTWRLTEGPAVRLMPTSDGVQRIVMKVRSLQQAKEFLKTQRWLGVASEREAGIAPSVVQGLNIRLVEN